MASPPRSLAILRFPSSVLRRIPLARKVVYLELLTQRPNQAPFECWVEFPDSVRLPPCSPHCPEETNRLNALFLQNGGRCLVHMESHSFRIEATGSALDVVQYSESNHLVARIAILCISPRRGAAGAERLCGLVESREESNHSEFAPN